MRRVEIIAPQRKFDEVMLYLREQNAVELLDVKEMIKGYGGGVTSATVSDRLYRLTTIESKINSVINALGISSHPAKPVLVEPRITDEEITEVEKRVGQIEQEVTSATNEAQALQSIVTYAEQQLEKNIQEIIKIENVNSPEGRHRLEEIVGAIFQILKPEEIKVSETLGELTQPKALQDAVVKDISDNVAQILASRHDEKAIAETITQTLGLKLKAVARNKRLTYEPTSRIEESKKRLKQIRDNIAEITRTDGEYLLVQHEIVAAERSFEQAKGYCGKTETTSMIEGWIPASKVDSIKSQLSLICSGEVIVKVWSSRDAPTRLQNPKFPVLSTFEKLTTGFGIPKSDELDPTVLWLITYPLFFGFMFGDVGNGIVMEVDAPAFSHANKAQLKRIPSQKPVARTRFLVSPHSSALPASLEILICERHAPLLLDLM
jgi:V/A-type H+-transporting ATPase subunit I